MQIKVAIPNREGETAFPCHHCTKRNKTVH